jgi:hypothetical protein
MQTLSAVWNWAITPSKVDSRSAYDNNGDIFKDKNSSGEDIDKPDQTPARDVSRNQIPGNSNNFEQLEESLRLLSSPCTPYTPSYPKEEAEKEMSEVDQEAEFSFADIYGVDNANGSHTSATSRRRRRPRPSDRAAIYAQHVQELVQQAIGIVTWPEPGPNCSLHLCEQV